MIVFEKENGRAAAYDGDALIGMCEFDETDGVWVIQHTEVDPAYSGQGIPRRMVLLVAEEAEKTGVEVRSVCTYARKVLGR